MRATKWHRRGPMTRFEVTYGVNQCTIDGPGVMVNLHTIGSDRPQFLYAYLTPDEAAALALKLQNAAREAGHKVQR